MNEFGVDETYEAMVADVHPIFRGTGCSDMEARHIVCPAMIRYAPPIGEGEFHKCPHCGGKIIPEYKIEKCELCGLPYTTEAKK